METTIISVVLSVLIIVCLLVQYYFAVKNQIKNECIGMINEAEVSGVNGKEKMNEVVDRLYDLVPVVFKKFLTKTVIEKIVQAIFDKIEAYATKQVLNKK